jgi:hypothetical protein
MKKLVFIIFLCCGVSVLFAQNSQPRQWDARSTEWYFPVPPKVQPAKVAGQPPSDAIILFDGKDLSKWESTKRVEGGNTLEPVQWKIVNGELHIMPGTGDIRTKEYFGDCQLHVEFKLPPPDREQGNSGVYLQSTYELQIYEGDPNTLYVNGMVGSMYKQSAPLVNAYTKNGEWQVYDIFWKAPVFNGEGELLSPAMITVTLNGIVIQNNYILKGDTPYRGLPKYTPHGRMPLLLQDHGSAVAFRTIWIRHSG